MIETPAIPGIEWPEPVITADLIIKDYLTAALAHSAVQQDAFNTRMDVPREDVEATKLARAKWHNQLYVQLWHASIADLLIQIQTHFPAAADQIARDFVARGEDEGNGEWIWEWATERGLDPESIIEDARAKIAEDKKAATPRAEKSVTEGAKELRRAKAAAYRETINLDAAEHPELAALETDIRTSLPHNMTGDAVVHYVARHLYTDGYRKTEGTK